jgi:hypothetical protein
MLRSYLHPSGLGRKLTLRGSAGCDDRDQRTKASVPGRSGDDDDDDDDEA